MHHIHINSSTILHVQYAHIWFVRRLHTTHLLVTGGLLLQYYGDLNRGSLHTSVVLTRLYYDFKKHMFNKNAQFVSEFKHTFLMYYFTEI
jgi:hypothetical protein